MSELTRELGELAGQFTFVSNSQQFAPQTFGQIVAANPLRWALLIQSAYDATAPAGSWIVGINPNLIAGLGLQYQLGMGRLELDYRRWGSLVQQAWYGGAPAAGNQVTIETIEVILVQ